MAKDIKDALQHAVQLANEYSDRDTMLEEIDEIYFMDWEDKPDEEQLKMTVSPEPSNKLKGAIRLMSATEPIFSVPYDTNKSDMKDRASTIEKICKSVWYHSGRFRGVPLEQPAIESLLRYGMMVLAIYDTQDLFDMLGKGKSKARKRQIERVTERTPYIIEAWDPKGVYPQWGRFGLTAVYRNTIMNVAEVRQQFGDEPISKILGGNNWNDADEVQYADYWDLENHYAWIASEVTDASSIAGTPIIEKEHNLPCIPIVVQTSEGSYIDNDKRFQAMPFLYTVWASDLWNRQNLILTYGYTNLFKMAANPTYILEDAGEDDEIFIDTTIPGGVVRTGRAKLKTLEKDVFNKDLQTGLDMAKSLIEESTIYSQSLGQPMGSTAAYSMVALLHQAGRLPLTSPQKRGGWGIGTAMELMFEMWKDKAQNKPEAKLMKARGISGMIELEVENLPDDLIIEAKLDIDLPQDMMSQANIAGMITGQGLASKQWVQENILNIGQPEDMQKQIWNEQASQALYQQQVQSWMQQQQMMQQQAMMAGQAPPMPQSGPPMPQEGPPMTPQGPGMQAQAGMVSSGRPGTQPIPPSAEAGGMQEGEVPL